jgi:hypothetical protein
LLLSTIDCQVLAFFWDSGIVGMHRS